MVSFRSHIQNSVPRTPVAFTGPKGTSTLPKIVAESVPEFSDNAKFYVNPLLGNGHLMTVYTALNEFNHVDHVNYKRIVLQVEDKPYTAQGRSHQYDHWKGKSTFSVDVVVPETDLIGSQEKFQPELQTRPLPPRTEYLDPEIGPSILSNEEKPLIIALHGLSGGSYESYIRAFLHVVTLEPYNFDALVVNSRGCAQHTITSPQLFCGLWTNDLRYFINEYVKVHWPKRRIYLIGFSLGGAILANYLGQEADEVYQNIRGAVCVGTPFDFTSSNELIRASYIGNRIYSPAMCTNLLKLLNATYDDKSHLTTNELTSDLIKDLKQKQNDLPVMRLVDFDDSFTSKLFGFNLAAEYYRHASPNQRLMRVRVPMVILSSHDDPITGSRSLPELEVRENPYTFMVTTSVGGHLGWFDILGRRWYAAPLAKLFKELDDHWQVDSGSLAPGDLPRDTLGTWNHDRLV